MDWTELQLHISSKDTEEASAIAQMAVPYGFYIVDYSDLCTEVPRIAHVDLIDEELLSKDPDKACIHIYLSPEENPMEAVSYLEQRLESAGIAHEIATNSVKEEDWATAWKQYYHPIPIGEKLVVCPSWETCDIGPGQVKLTLDPGMAFGTGTHETTYLCLEMLEDYAAPGKTLLDVGCGSGILAIAGALLGCERGVGVDIDEMAVRVAQENSERNGTDRKVQFVCGDLVDKVSGTFDIVCANIVADTVIRLMGSIRPFMAQGGVLILSGIIEEREQDVLAAMERHGFGAVKTMHQKGWVAIACEVKG